MGEVELPRGIALAWGIAADPQRGPKRELSVEKIVDTAIEIADADGLASVSMSSLATRLGYTTMSLYRYVSAKDDLIVLMNDEGLGQPPDHDPIDDDWRTGLRRWAGSAAATYARHPWLLDIPVDGTPITPNSLSWLDWGLRILAPARLSSTDAVAAVLMVSGLARWQAIIDRAIAGGEDAAADAERYVFTELLDAEHYPALVAALADGGMSDEEADDPFRFALERALDGLAVVVGSGDATRPEPDVATPTEPQDLEQLVDYPRDVRLKEATRARREAEARLREADGKLREARRREHDLITKAKQKALSAERG